MSILNQARANRPEPRRIDYARMQREFPKQKAALTRARKSGDPERVALECQRAIKAWNEIGAWPDDWAHWQRTLDDMLPWHAAVQLDDLPLI